MGKLGERMKARGPREMAAVLSAALALSAPNFSRATAYVVALPDAAYALPVLLATLAALYVMYANRLPRYRAALVLGLSAACVAFESVCAWMQRTCPDWNYLSVNAGLNLIGRALRLAAFCSFALQAGHEDGKYDDTGRRAGACLAVTGMLGALALWCLGELECPREETLALSLAGWAYLAALIALGMARGAAAGVPFAHGAFAFLIGAFIGNDAATILAGGLGPGADAPWVLPVFAVLAAASLVPMAVPLARGAAAGTAGGVSGTAPDREGRNASALGAIPGAEALSEREAQVAAAELSGATDADIASELGLKPQTVATYRSRAYQKLGVTSRAGLVEVARSCSGPAGAYAQGGGDQAVASAPLPISRSSVVFRAAIGTAALPLLAALLRTTTPLPAQRAVLLAASVLLLAKGTADLAHTGGWDCAGREGLGHAAFEPQVLAGCICACVGAVVSPQLPALPGWRALAAPAATFLCLVWVFTAARNEPTRALTVMTCGVVGLLTVQAGPYGLQAPTSWPQLAMPLAGLLAVASLGIDRKLAERELSDALLVGEARCESYLRGRGLSELEASVLILSAKRLSRAAIAESLAISLATVSAYRSRGVKKLGAEDLEAAFALMREEGGLDEA